MEKKQWIECDGEQVPTMRFWLDMSMTQNRRLDQANFVSVVALIASAASVMLTVAAILL